VQCGDRAGVGRRHLDDALRGLDLGDRLVDTHDVADCDEPLHERGLGQSLTQVGQPEDLRALQ
jgi:hypothetical protein